MSIAQNQTPRVLVVDDDDSARSFVARTLTRHGFDSLVADGGRKAIASLNEHRFDAVVCDLLMPEVDGLDVLRHCGSLRPPPSFVMLTAHGSVAVAVDAMKLGAIDFLEKPVSGNELEAALRSALGREEVQRKSSPQRNTTKHGLVGSESWLRPFSELLRKIASTDAIVLIEGETGTGKSAVAKEIWRLSRRADGPFIDVNCAAITPNLVENELFGNIKGAFTGAIGQMGKIEKANQGTLFLDEIGELPLEVQPKLLQVLQERTFMPVGGSSQRKSDARFIAATNRNLELEARAGKFRPDLYFRLDVVKLIIPPLRQRIEDVPILLESFRQQAAERHGRAPVFPPETLTALCRYDWPGNVRELENLVARLSVMLETDEEAKVEHLPDRIQRASGAVNQAASRESPVPPTARMQDVETKPLPRPPGIDDVAREGLSKAVKTYESRIIRHALTQTNDNVTQAAELLGVKRTTLIEKRKRFTDLGLL